MDLSFDRTLTDYVPSTKTLRSQIKPIELGRIKDLTGAIRSRQNALGMQREVSYHRSFSHLVKLGLKLAGLG